MELTLFILSIYHKHPTVHFAMERTWFILLVLESRTPPRYLLLSLSTSSSADHSSTKKNPKSQRAVESGFGSFLGEI